MQNAIAGRQSRIIERTKQTVKILSIFEEQLKSTHLLSGIVHIIMRVVKNGRANMVLKATAKKRKTREEIDAIKKQKKLDDDHYRSLVQIEAELNTRRVNFQDIPNVIEQNQRMLAYMKEHGIIRESAPLNEQSP